MKDFAKTGSGQAGAKPVSSFCVSQFVLFCVSFSFCFVLCVCLTGVDWIKARVTHPSHLKAAAAAAAAAQTAELYAIGSTALHQLIESCI
jgi:hypothetical protein